MKIFEILAGLLALVVFFGLVMAMFVGCGAA